jgi:hypothetical protein
MDAASHGGKDEVRELAERAMFAPMRSVAKVYIIDEAQGLTNQGAQALLRLIEEPPTHVYFMLATTDPHKMLPTIRGRCAEYELKRPGSTELRENLIRVARGEGWALGDEAADALVEYSDPVLGVRGTLMALEKLSGELGGNKAISVEAVAAALGEMPRDMGARLWEAVVGKRAREAFELLDDLRMNIPEEVIRASLVESARSALVSALSTGDGTAGASWRYQVLVEAPKGNTYTEVALLKLVRPQVAWDSVSIEAMVERLESVLVLIDGVGVGAISDTSLGVTEAERDANGTARQEDRVHGTSDGDGVSTAGGAEEETGPGGDVGEYTTGTGPVDAVVEVDVPVVEGPLGSGDAVHDDGGEMVGNGATPVGGPVDNIAVAILESDEGVGGLDFDDEVDESIIWGTPGAVTPTSVGDRDDQAEPTTHERFTTDSAAMSGLVEEFMELAEERCTRATMAALRACRIAVDEDNCAVTGPDAVVSRLDEPRAHADLLEVCADLGVTLTISAGD